MSTIKISQLPSITGANTAGTDLLPIVDTSLNVTNKITRSEFFTNTPSIGVSGNITVTGTVDGRDVAADGTKLDGIEAGADVTDTANVTAAGALMDSELTNIAAVKALNQGVSTTNSPTFAGATVTGNLTVDTNTLFVNSTTNRVGVGTTSPETSLDVVGTVSSDGLSVVGNSSVTGVTTVSTGTASAPSVSFSGDADTGFYQSAPNTLNITTGGTEAATFEDAGQTVFQLLSSGGDQLLNVDETTDDLLQVINSDNTVLFQVSNTNGVSIGPAKTPASATATGVAGQVAWDANYIYICTATNTWKRVAIATW